MDELAAADADSVDRLRTFAEGVKGGGITDVVCSGWEGRASPRKCCVRSSASGEAGPGFA